MPGWDFTVGDRFHVADFNGDGKKDLFVCNGSNWAISYVGMLRSTGTGFSLVKRFDANMPVGRCGSGTTTPSVTSTVTARRTSGSSTASDWSIPYVGMLRSTGASLAMSKRYDGSMPGWQMQPHDRHYVGDFDGDGKADLYVFNGTNWSMAYLGMLSSTGSQLSMAHRYDGNVPGWQMRATTPTGSRTSTVTARPTCSSTTTRTGRRSTSER